MEAEVQPARPRRSDARRNIESIVEAAAALLATNPRASMQEVAEAAGVEDMDAWDESRADPKWDSVSAETENAAIEAGFTGTPSVLVRGPGGEEILGTFPDTAAIEAAIKKVG